MDERQLSTWAVGAVATMGLLGGWVSSVQGGPEPGGVSGSTGGSVYEKIWRLERIEGHHRDEVQRLRESLGAGGGADATAFSEREAAEAASRRVRRDIASVTAGWTGMTRRVRQLEPMLAPGEARRMAHVLQRAKLAAYRGLDERLHTWRKLSSRATHPAVFLQQRASRTVQLAQHEGAADAAKEQKEKVVREETAEEGGEQKVREDMADTAEKLDESMDTLLEHETGEDFHRRKGALIPPVGTKPVAKFGQRKQDNSMSYVRHTGLTYRVDLGTDVRAVADGLVVHARRFEGFGRLLIVDHGDNYHSLYAHLKGVTVEVGDSVQRGQTVAISGASGSLEGPKLYFELRHDGKPIDPASWFVRTGGSEPSEQED